MKALVCCSNQRLAHLLSGRRFLDTQTCGSHCPCSNVMEHYPRWVHTRLAAGSGDRRCMFTLLCNCLLCMPCWCPMLAGNTTPGGCWLAAKQSVCSSLPQPVGLLAGGMQWSFGLGGGAAAHHLCTAVLGAVCTLLHSCMRPTASLLLHTLHSAAHGEDSLLVKLEQAGACL